MTMLHRQQAVGKQDANLAEAADACQLRQRTGYWFATQQCKIEMWRENTHGAAGIAEQGVTGIAKRCQVFQALSGNGLITHASPNSLIICRWGMPASTKIPPFTMKPAAS